MWQALIAPITGLVNTVMSNRRAKQAAQEEVNQILTKAAANNEELAGKIALARVTAEKDSIKDEVALFTIILPYWVAMVCALFGVDTLYVQAMFENMAAIPEYWQQTFQWGIWGVLGIVGTKKLLNT